jgi:hypothetical protein
VSDGIEKRIAKSVKRMIRDVDPPRETLPLNRRNGEGTEVLAVAESLFMGCQNGKATGIGSRFMEWIGCLGYEVFAANPTEVTR